MNSKANKDKPEATARAAEVLREYGPFVGAGRIHGVTHDGQRVWAATGDKLIAFDSDSGERDRTQVLRALLPLSVFRAALHSPPDFVDSTDRSHRSSPCTFTPWPAPRPMAPAV